MMCNVLIACVNYNTPCDLAHYLESINNAASISDDIQITVLVVENSTLEKAIHANNYSAVQLIIYRSEQNLGYLGGVREALKNMSIKPELFDYFIISNVDITINKMFFVVLQKLSEINDIGWIAPQIYSLKEKRDRNPKLLKRPSQLKFRRSF